MATGWLGWSPEVAWKTPVPEILVACDARIEWARMANPFGGGSASPEKPKETRREKFERIKNTLKAAAS